MQTIDPYESVHQYRKLTDPTYTYTHIPMRRDDVAAIDRLIKIAGNSRDVVISDEDWRLVEIIFQFWAERWPEEFIKFKKQISDTRETGRYKGLSKTKEIKFTGALPEDRRFERMVKVIFPFQQFDKKFVNKLIKRIPLLMVGGA